MNRAPLLHSRKSSHECIIIAFYDEGAGLVAVNVAVEEFGRSRLSGE